MTTIKNFEELDCWKKARELAGHIYELTRKEKFSHDFGLRDQIQRAAGSIMHNIAEGFESGYDPEFIRFLKMARRSTARYSLSCIWQLTLCTLPKTNSKGLTPLRQSLIN